MGDSIDSYGQYHTLINCIRRARPSRLQQSPEVFPVIAASGAKPHHPLVEEKTNDLIALQAASTLPPGIADLLPEEPSTIREAQASLEWPQVVRNIYWLIYPFFKFEINSSRHLHKLQFGLRHEQRGA